jgi:TM2 domain-containing membrane protein YozV
MSMDEALQKEDSLRTRVSQLDEDKRKIYYSRIKKSIKDPDTYAVLNWLFIAGLHHFYLKNYLRGFLNLVGFMIGIISLFSGQIIFGIVIISVILVFELYELFFSQSIIIEYNNKISEDILSELNESN